MGLNIRLTVADGVSLDAVVEKPLSDLYRGVVVLAHGISADLEEDGRFGPLAHELAGQGFASVRFSFRGHGRSDGEQQQVTIAGDREYALRVLFPHLVFDRRIDIGEKS